MGCVVAIAHLGCIRACVLIIESVMQCQKILDALILLTHVEAVTNLQSSNQWMDLF